MTTETTPPPLDLAALREKFERASSSKYAGVIEPTVMLALIARAEAAEANHAKAERKANDLFDIGIREKKRAIAAEAKVAAVEAVISRYHEVGGHVCDDLDKDCARCVADEAMDALDGSGA